MFYLTSEGYFRAPEARSKQDGLYTSGQLLDDDMGNMEV